MKLLLQFVMELGGCDVVGTFPTAVLLDKLLRVVAEVLFRNSLDLGLLVSRPLRPSPDSILRWPG